ncbi:hypothetical protein TorRG33x02_104520 [Trema orientale]|uniref:Uncharacterized protein n=1 Tax=Trema orientale TaxID=63057 RepID=A0A2P5F7L2_TREOI|nr:hypothetical protein TorRG33x02_104520 [Trema orientale]
MGDQTEGGNVRIDVNALVADLKNMMYENLPLSSRCCIFRIPNVLMRHSPKAYAPNAFSIGPFHYNKPHLKANQKIKLKYLYDLISRIPGTDAEKKLRVLMAAISDVRKEARECYEGSIGMSMDEFVKVLVLDGCFLIELFCKGSYREFRRKNDPIFGVNFMNTVLSHDLILLENQIPWLVLDRLSSMTIAGAVALPLNGLIANFFVSFFSRGEKLCMESDKHYEDEYYRDKHKEYKHILDLFRDSLIFPSSIAKQDKGSLNCVTDWKQMPTATSLQEAGIRFKRATSSMPSNILDIKFRDGVLEIPQLLIQDMTESLLRNLICYEQCLPHCEEVITSYAVLLDSLINTPKDMEILCKSEIIDNLMDIEDATIFFNRIFNDASMRLFYYLPLVDEVNKYCRRRWPRYRRVLIHDYFKHPWALTSVMVAAMLLILTLLQTVFTLIK